MAGESQGRILYTVEMDISQLVKSQQTASDRLSNLDSSFAKSSKSAESFGLVISKVAGAITAALSIREITEYANAWVNVSNKLVNAVRPTEDLATVTQRVFKISQDTRASLEATATLYGRLERATRAAGTSTDDLAKLTETINKGLVVSGATAEEASSTMIQLSQALASGVLRGEEFNSISENGSRLAVALADSLGVTVGQLRNMAAQGALTTDVVVKGLLSQAVPIANEFAKTTLTMSQAFTVATNNITKFVGESSSTNTVLNVFNSSVISLSENLNTVATAIGIFAAVMGSRFVGALAMSTAARISDIAAATKQSQAMAQAATDSQIEAAAQLRLAKANQDTALSALNLAQAELSVMKATNASTVSAVANADAQVASARVTVQQLQSEKLLEAQRLKAQITETGRIATATRMAEIQQASAVATQRLAAAEVAAAGERATALAAAEASVSSARLSLASATGTATAANGAYIASTEAATAASAAATTTIGGLARGALSLIGGPAGAAVLAGGAIFYFFQKAQQAKQESIDFADKLDSVISKMKEMSQVQLAAEIDNANKSITVQNSQLSENEATLAGLNVRLEAARKAVQDLGTGSLLYAGALDNLNTLESQSIQLTAKVENERNKLSQTISKTGILSAQMNGTFEQGIDLLRRDGQEVGVTTGLLNQLGNALDIAGKAKDNFNSKSLILPENAKVQQYVDGLREESDLLAISDKRLRSVTEARNKAFAAGGNVNQVNAAGDLAGTIYDQQKAEQEAAKATKAGAKEADAGAQKIADLQRQLEFLNLTYGESDREAAILNATQAASGKVTDEQKAKIGQLAGALFDAKQKQSDLNAAIEADPTRKENKSFDEATKTLNRQLAEGIVSQTQFNEQSEKLAMNHQIALAQIQANQAVTPQAQAAGTVDPVQQLANENAQKLALIQAYEAQGVITHQNALMQMNALDTEYETARNAALWKQWADQSAVNTLMAGAIDALGSQASSAITGFLNGTQSANEALQNVANTILNSVVQGFVEMGLAQVRAAVTGAAAQQAATVATTTTAVAGIATTTAASTTAAGTTLAAWLPAALVASVGSFGAAAIIGGAALVGAFALSKTLGKRKNGGPVTAGGMYQVGEGGAPELYQGANGRQYMIPGDNGSVISNKDLGTSGTGSTGSNVSVNVHNYGSSQVQTNQSTAADGTLTIDMVLSDLQEGGPLSQGIANNFTTKRKANQ